MGKQAQVTLTSKRVLLIIGGGIAAYKALDLIRRLREIVSATPALLARNQAATLERQQEQFEKLLRNGLLPGKLCNERRPASVVAGKGVQSAQAVLRSFGESLHGLRL